MEDISKENFYQDWKTVLIPRLQENQTWIDFFDAISDIFAKNIYFAINQLRLIREPTLQDREVNISQSKFLGFNYNSKYFTDLGYINLVTFLNKYNTSIKGTDKFINFIGWVTNARFQITQLWAKGKRNYSDGPITDDTFSEATEEVLNNSKIDGTGTKEWYPTSHVNITYDAELYEINEEDVKYLFYKTAPINLVLNSLAAIFTSDVTQLYIRNSLSDYERSFTVIPCFYRYEAPFNLLSISKSSSLSKIFWSGYGYNIRNTLQYNNFIFFDKNCIAQDLINTGISVSRNGIATNIERGTYYPSTVETNYPRLSYEPESSINHWKGKGLLIEPSRTNLMLDSSNPINRTVSLQPGTYTFSVRGKYRLINTSTGEEIGEVENNYYTFIITQDSLINVLCLETNSHSYYQLERGSSPTSYIPTTNLRVENRGPEIITYNNLYNQNSTNSEASYFITFSDNIELNCTLLYIYQSQGNFIRLSKNYNLLTLSIYNNNSLLGYLELDYDRFIELFISKEKIRLNGNEWKYPQGNGIVANLIYLGQESGNNAINGYIENFEFYPVFSD